MMAIKRQNPFRVVMRQLVIFVRDQTVITIQDSPDDGAVGDLLFRIQQRLPFAGSKVRLGAAQHLVLNIIDRLVDDTR